MLVSLSVVQFSGSLSSRLPSCLFVSHCLSLSSSSFYLSVSLSISSSIERKECKRKAYETWDSQWYLRADAQPQSATPPAAVLPLQPARREHPRQRRLAMAALPAAHLACRHHPPSCPWRAATAMYRDCITSPRYR